jgi:hypothetical protein
MKKREEPQDSRRRRRASGIDLSDFLHTYYPPHFTH